MLLPWVRCGRAEDHSGDGQWRFTQHTCWRSDVNMKRFTSNTDHVLCGWALLAHPEPIFHSLGWGNFWQILLTTYWAGEAWADVNLWSSCPRWNGYKSKASTMGKIMVLGAAKSQNTVWWDFSPKHSLEDENIKCYKAINHVCLVTQWNTWYCVALPNLVFPSKLFEAHCRISVTEEAILTLPQGCWAGQLSHLSCNPQWQTIYPWWKWSGLLQKSTCTAL